MWRKILSQRMLLCLSTGFSSGLPLYVIYQMIPAWLKNHNVDLKTIGLFSLISIPYVWKFLWAALLDQPLPFTFKLSLLQDRRRSWAILCQSILAVLLASLAFLSPLVHMKIIVLISLGIAFFSASQDIVLDAYRREILEDEELGLGNSFFVNAYRLSSLVPGSLALFLSEQTSWQISHLTVAAFMFSCVGLSLWMPEPQISNIREGNWQRMIILPIKEFLHRNGYQQSILILGFMIFYKLGDSMATALSTPFYLDLGFSNTDIASIVKVASLWSSIAGGFVGGLLMLRIGIYRSLWYFGIVQLLTILGFGILAWDSQILLISQQVPFVTGGEIATLFNIRPNHSLLFIVVSAEYLGVGLGTAAFVAFIAQSTNKQYTAAQFALLSSFSGLPRTFAAASSGYVIQSIGYTHFFWFCTILAIPGLVFLRFLKDAHSNQKDSNFSKESP